MKSRRIHTMVWGSALLIFSICWTLAALNIINFNVLFDGWWAVLIIVACLSNLFTDKNKTGASIGLAVGVLLLLGARGVISWEQVGKLVIGVVIIIAALGMILGHLFKKKFQEKAESTELQTTENGRLVRRYEVTFGEQEVKLDGKAFDKAEIQCRFGAMRIDLRQAQIAANAEIMLDCSFGAVEILLPTNVAVKTNINSSFGGVEIGKNNSPGPDSPTLLLEGKVSFAGVEVKFK